ncbi:MAG TPA: HEAT repeat domain-containing protein [Polyangiaceae bacterium]
MMGRRGRLCALLLLLAPWDAAARSAGSITLDAKLGLTTAERLLKSDQQVDRLRGIERLGSLTSARALSVLVRSVERGATSASAPEERLALVRALATNAHRVEVRRALVRLLTWPSGRGTEASDGLDARARESAALALARSRTPEAMRALAIALREEGATAQAVRSALLAHPPTDLLPLLEAKGTPSVALARTLGDLGDLRAFHTLRRFVQHGSPEVRAEAALSLTRLGALETVELARHWLAKAEVPELQRAGAEILALTRADGWPEAIARLLLQPESRAAGLRLANEAPHPRLVPALAATLAESSDPALVLSALGRTSAPEAVRVLERELNRARHRAASAYALSQMEGAAAEEALERALARPLARTLAARALVVRYTRRRGATGVLEQSLERLLRGRTGDERAAGAWGLAVLDEARAPALLRSSDKIVVRAAARAALRGEAALAAAARLQKERDPLTRSALAACLIDPVASDHVPTRTLEVLLDDVPGAAPLVARALASRDAPDQRSRLEQLLESAEPTLRAHVALGLGASAWPSAVGLLEQSYEFEPSAEVRRAIVVALSGRRESTRLRTLRLAAALDGDAAVRQSARLALAGQNLALTGSGGGTLWLQVLTTDGAGAAGRALEVQTATGLVLPAVSDPSGIVAFTALPEGPVALRLADAPRHNDPSGP